MAAEVVAALPSNSSCDELEETIPESMRMMRDVKCELVARRYIIFLTVERHSHVHEFPNGTAVFDEYTSHIQLKFALGLLFFTKL